MSLGISWQGLTCPQCQGAASTTPKTTLKIESMDAKNRGSIPKAAEPAEICLAQGSPHTPLNHGDKGMEQENQDLANRLSTINNHQCLYPSAQWQKSDPQSKFYQLLALQEEVKPELRLAQLVAWIRAGEGEHQGSG